MAYLSIAGLVATLGCLVWFDVAGITGTLFANMFVLDRMALFFKMFIVGSTILVILASIDYVHRFRFFRGEYYFLVVMSALGMMFMASANDLLSVFVTLEFSTFGFYVLVAYLREDMASNEAGIKFFILGVFAAGLLAYGISLVYGETGKLVFSDMTAAQATPGLIIGFLLIFAALGFKIGAVPFHSWIPDTYHGSPTPVTAFLSIAPKGAAFAILLRMFFVALVTFKPIWTSVACRGLHPVHDLRQHRGDRAKEHQAALGLFRYRADRQHPDRAGGRNKDGQRRHLVLPPDLSVRQPRGLRRRHRGQPGHRQRGNRRLQRLRPPVAVSCLFHVDFSACRWPGCPRWPGSSANSTSSSRR